MEEKIFDCFKSARKDEEQNKKHKGLLVTEPSQKNAEYYLDKAQDSIRLCDVYKNFGFDYKLPEEGYYSLYYCALAILCKFGIESRSQACTALFMKYAKEKGLIEYDDEFIKNILVFKEKGVKTFVDEREEARYGPKIKMDDVKLRYDSMLNLCKKALFQAQDIVFSEKKYEIPKEFF